MNFHAQSKLLQNFNRLYLLNNFRYVKIVPKKEAAPETERSILKNNNLKDLKHSQKYVKPVNVEKERTKLKTQPVVEIIKDADKGFSIQKLEKNSPQINTAIMLIKSNKQMEKNHLMLLEGKRLIKDGLENGCEPVSILFSRKTDFDYIKNSLPKHNSTSLYQVPYKELQMWSDLTTSPGIMGIFKIPDTSNRSDTKNAIPLTVICDNIREPGNLGSIIRNLAAVGGSRLLLTKGCVGPWSTKVLRSGAGAQFHIAIEDNLTWSDITEKLPSDVATFIADDKTDENIIIPEETGETSVSIPVIPYFEGHYNGCGPIVIIVGGETEGLSLEAYKFLIKKSGVRIHIPLMNNVNSLNSGTTIGIIAFEIRRQLFKSKSNK